MTGQEANDASPHGAAVAMMNGDRRKLDQVDEVTARRAEEAWKQLRLARYRIPAPETMTMYRDPIESHDDFARGSSSALVTEALASFSAPPESG